MSISTIFFDIGCALEDATRATAEAAVRASRGTCRGVVSYRTAVREKRTADEAAATEAAEKAAAAEAVETRLNELYETALSLSSKYIILAAEAERAGFGEDDVRRIVLRTYARDMKKKYPELGKEVEILTK